MSRAIAAPIRREAPVTRAVPTLIWAMQPNSSSRPWNRADDVRPLQGRQVCRRGGGAPPGSAFRSLVIPRTDRQVACSGVATQFKSGDGRTSGAPLVVLTLAILLPLTVLIAAFVLAPLVARERVIFDPTPDRPAPFGLKMAWLAIRTRDTARVMDTL